MGAMTSADGGVEGSTASGAHFRRSVSEGARSHQASLVQQGRSLSEGGPLRQGESFMSNVSHASIRADKVALSFTDPNVSRPIDLAEERAQHRAEMANKPQHSILMKLVVVCFCLYCSPATALWQQSYKGTQEDGGGKGCSALWAKVEAGLRVEVVARSWPQTIMKLRDFAAKGYANERRLEAEALEQKRWASGDWEDALKNFGTSFSKTSPEAVGPGETYFDETLQHPRCSWHLREVRKARPSEFMWQDKELEICGRHTNTNRKFCERIPGCKFLSEAEAPGGAPGCYFKECNTANGQICYKRRINAYSKGFALSLVTVIALWVHWGWAYYIGGFELFRTCFDWTKMSRFAVIGSLFGMSSVFGFLGQSRLTPGSYLIIAQTSIIWVPVLWRLVFRTPLPTLSWMHIIMTAFGIFTYFSADMENDTQSGGSNVSGLVFSFTKVLLSAVAAVLTDLYLKTLDDIPFPVQVSYILPFKALASLLTDFLLPPHRWPPLDLRPGGPFHDWNFDIFLILIHSLADTVSAGIIVNVFDAVVKAVIAVMSIVFPTWIVSYCLGWENIEFETAQGKLKITGACVVVFSALAYTFGRAQAKKLQSTEDRINELEKMAEERKKASRGRVRMGNVEMVSKDAA